MKKALIVLLILAVAGGLFAQSWSGSVATGAKITFKDDIPVMATADGDDNKAVKASVNFNNSGDDWGITVSTSAKVDTDNVPSGITIGDMKGWVKFADIFKLTVGKGIGDAWTTGGNTDAKINSGGNASYRLEITPIDGLNFGFRFAYPDGKVKASTIGNFFQETGIGAKYTADVWNAATGLELVSEEAGGLDGNWYFGFNYTGLDIVSIHFGGKANNLFAKKADMDFTLYEKFSGSVAGLGWFVQANEKLVPDPLTAALSAGVDYGISISDKASATVGAEVDLTILKDFSFDGWDVFAELVYKFNGKVSTTAYFEVDGDKDNNITPWLRWTIGFNF